MKVLKKSKRRISHEIKSPMVVEKNKKLAKGISVEQITDDLEETVETIQELIKTLPNQ